jgi:hypothetical protein
LGGYGKAWQQVIRYPQLYPPQYLCSLKSRHFIVGTVALHPKNDDLDLDHLFMVLGKMPKIKYQYFQLAQ